MCSRSKGLITRKPVFLIAHLWSRLPTAFNHGRVLLLPTAELKLDVDEIVRSADFLSCSRNFFIGWSTGHSRFSTWPATMLVTSYLISGTAVVEEGGSGSG